MISTSPNKEKEARERLGADHFIVSKDDKAMAVRPSSTLGCILCRCHCAAMSQLCCSAVCNGCLVSLWSYPQVWLQWPLPSKRATGRGRRRCGRWTAS